MNHHGNPVNDKNMFRGFTDYPVFGETGTQNPNFQHGYQPQHEQAFQVNIYFEQKFKSLPLKL